MKEKKKSNLLTLQEQSINVKSLFNYYKLA